MTARELKWLLDEKYNGIETPAFFADRERLATGEPLAYLIGHVPFLGTTIFLCSSFLKSSFLNSRPLIPRPETEYWVGEALTEIRPCAKAHGRISVLDLCAGSGCIGVAVLKAVPEARVDFCEIDSGHHETIRKNLRENDIDPSRARIYGGDLFSEIPKGTVYGFILTNPPYIDPVKISRVEKSVVQYEPARALFGGTGGMECIAQIIAESPHSLAHAGTLYIEHEPEQIATIHTLAQSFSYASCETHKDQYQIERYTRLAHTK